MSDGRQLIATLEVGLDTQSIRCQQVRTIDAEPKWHCRLELKDQLMDRLNAIENLYNRSDDKTKNRVERYQINPPLVLDPITTGW